MDEKIVLNVGSEKLIGILTCPGSKTNLDSCVISCHGLLASKDGPKYLLLAKELSEVGISSIRFDFRGCGLPQIVNTCVGSPIYNSCRSI